MLGVVIASTVSPDKSQQCRAIQDAGFGSVYSDSPRCPEVGFEDIAVDLPQARLWTAPNVQNNRLHKDQRDVSRYR